MSETMRTSSQKMPFLGFTFRGKHSSEFGIIRVINGNRLKEDLTPGFQDITQEIEGADGMLYYGTKYKKKDFVIDFAFDNLSESQLVDLKSWLNGREIGDLEFDERKGIIYSAKVTGKAVVNYIPFEGVTENSTIYKGEGNITFTCYFPFGRRTMSTTGQNNVYIIEVGDLPSRPVIQLGEVKEEDEIIIRKENSTGSVLLAIKADSDISNLTIDCKRFLITDGTDIYNHWITQGDFFSTEDTRSFWISKTATVTYDKLSY